MKRIALASRWVAAGVAVASGSLASWSSGQTSAADDVMYGALQIVSKIEETAGCDLSLHGEPQLDELTDRWLVAYSGVGTACDDLGAALQSAGIPAEITFFRRPNGDEVMTLAGRMRASVRRGYPCQISFKDAPQFDEESNLWSMRYYASGEQCGDASEELERQGRSFRIAFHRTR